MQLPAVSMQGKGAVTNTGEIIIIMGIPMARDPYPNLKAQSAVQI